MKSSMTEEPLQEGLVANQEQRIGQDAPARPAWLETNRPADQEIESDWSDVEERKPLPQTAAPMELDEGPSGEIKSKHEIKVQPFSQTETDSQREARLRVKSTQGPLIKIGNIDALVEDRVIIVPVDRIILDIENFVITKDRRVFGVIEDVFGPVEKPYYSVLKDQFVKEMFAEGKIKVGDALFCLSSEMKDLNQDRINELKERKGCDASNKFDEEPMGHNEVDDIYYSDDELESGSQRKGRKEFMGKRDRDMDEEEWTKNKNNRAKVQELKQKHDNQPRPAQSFSHQAHTINEQLPMTATHGHSNAQVLLGHPQQVHYAPQYSSYMAPIIPQMTPEQVLSYNHYLAQINMMYGLPPFAQNNYMQPPVPQQTYLPQDPNHQFPPNYLGDQKPNPQ
jgi:H/ACA ribonucleoprotein complex non-core subunit NAF1